MNEPVSAPPFVETVEYLRFAEFCDACRDFRYIGLCHGPPGVGKTLSARHYAQADLLDDPVPPRAMPGGKLEILQELNTVLFTVSVTNTPRMIERGIQTGRQRLLDLLLEPVLRAEEAIRREERRRRLDHRELLRLHDWSTGPPPGPASFAAGKELLGQYQERRRGISDPARLVIMDEADWLRLDSMEILIREASASCSSGCQGWRSVLPGILNFTPASDLCTPSAPSARRRSGV